MKRYRIAGAGVLAAAAVGLLWNLPLTRAQTPADEAVIVLEVPAAAEVRIGRQVSNQTGTRRTFFTGKLQPGFSYQYEFSVTWKDDGKDRTVSRWITVRPGETRTVAFGPKTLPVQPKKEIPKKEPPKKEPPKKEPPKKESPKKEPPKKVLPKKVGSEKEREKSRTFLFSYGGKVTDLKPGVTARIWLPIPQSTPLQQVKMIEHDLPAKPSVGVDKEYGNRILSFEAAANAQGEIPFDVIYHVERKEVRTGNATATAKIMEPRERLGRFLQPDKLVPAGGKSLDLIKKKVPSDPFAAAKLFYDVVNSHMKYDKSVKGWGRGDAVWACDSKAGNCTDFHSLFISMARGHKIPGKFEMGFSIPEKRGMGPVGGYHCWAWFLPEGKQWIPVDISEANRHPDLREYYFGNLTEDRVQFTTGRDLRLVPEQKGPALNFFIYPYAEVDGVPYPQENIVRRFEYLDE